MLHALWMKVYMILMEKSYICKVSFCRESPKNFVLEVSERMQVTNSYSCCNVKVCTSEKRLISLK